jgi:folate-binding protein YgfZ
VCARLEKYVIADDVEIVDRSAAFAYFALEGPRAGEILAAAAGRDPGLAPGACADAVLGDAAVLVASLGVSGECAFQILVARSQAPAVAGALRAAGADRALVTAGADALEILRIEAGVPRYRAELDESVLPDEARLDAAVSTTKGCYTGQEVVARIRSRGQVAHLLIGIAFEGDAPVAPDTPVTAAGRRVGEVTSACVSPAAGSIALAFARRSDARPGGEVDADGRRGRVVELPFVAATPA